MQTFNLDITKKGVVPLLYAKQRNVGTRIRVQVTDNGEDYSIPADVSFSVWYSGKSGEGNYTAIDGKNAFSVDGNTVTVELIYQMLNNAGEHEMCLVMNGTNGSQIGLWNIPYYVEAIPGADSEAAMAYYNAFLAAQKKAEEAANRAEEAANRAEEGGVASIIVGLDEGNMATHTALEIYNAIQDKKTVVYHHTDRLEDEFISLKSANPSMAVFSKTGYPTEFDVFNINIYTDGRIAYETTFGSELLEQNALVSYLPQTLTEEQKAQARENIGAADALGAIVTPYTAPEVDEDGKYVYYSNGRVEAAAAFCIYTPITVKAGQVIRFNAMGYATNVAILSKYDNTNVTYAPLIISTDSDEHIFEYTAQEDGQYAICSNKSVAVTYMVRCPFDTMQKDIADLDGRVGDIEHSLGGYTLGVEYPNKGYVSKGGVFYSPHPLYETTDPFPLSFGDTITFDSAVTDENAVAVLSRWNEQGDTCLEVIAIGTTESQTVTYTTTESKVYLRITKNAKDTDIYPTSTPVITTDISSALRDIGRRMDEIADGKTTNDVFSFVNVGVIGDSLASGAVNYKNASGDTATKDCPTYSWGKYMEREHGIPVTLFSKGGASTRSWLTAEWGLSAMQSANPCDCYIIGLGVNDKSSLGTNYLGTSADVTIGNEDSNADTFYGNYSKIIASLLAKSPRCKIFCLTMPSTQSDPANTFNVAIRDIVDMYDNAHLIDLEGDSYFGSSEYTALWNVAHSTATGYKAIADHLWYRFNKYIRENLSDFTDVQWILEDYE
ncbi:MAG: SGNH/GDSL hydrolase family protein [Oscillospiraceae bacterium]|nr:SGNH/GDSL hydrolase family protein [Oscillospiraceae bacterium]